MAKFLEAYQLLRQAEGGAADHPDDKGGQTYAGISRKFHPNWPGWAFIDRGEAVPEELVEIFYQDEYWNRLRLDSLISQKVANSIFSYAVNAGIRPAVMMVQRIVSVTPDGSVGPITIYALNNTTAELFLTKFALARIQHRADVCTADPSQKAFLLGWIRRDLKEASC